MIDTQHTFPLPEVATHKLDEVQEELRHQPSIVRMGDFLRSHAWLKVMIGCAAAALIGSWLKNRRHH